MSKGYSFEDFALACQIILQVEDNPELLEDQQERVRYDWALDVKRRFNPAGLSDEAL